MDNFRKFITRYNSGDVVYKRGDIQTDFYILNRGKVQVKAGDGDWVCVTLGKGDFFGEESLNLEQKAIHTVEVVEESDIIKIPFTALTDMIKQSTDIAFKILRKLSDKHVKIEEAFLARKAPEKPAKEKTSPAASGDDRTGEKIDPKISAYLVIQRSNRIVQLTRVQTYLGRRDYTTGFVPDIDLTEEDEEKYISRKHSQIFFKDGKFYLSEEPGAINGTFLNGRKLNTGVKYELHNEDELTLCHINIVFKY